MDLEKWLIVKNTRKEYLEYFEDELLTAETCFGGLDNKDFLS